MNKIAKAGLGIFVFILLVVIAASLPATTQQEKSASSAVSSASVAVQQASSSAIYVMSNFCNATKTYIASINADATLTPQQKQTDIANATANWQAEYQEFKSAGVTYNCDLSAAPSTTSQAASSSSNSSVSPSKPPYLYFSVSCDGCTTRGQPPQYNGLWNASWTESQYAGYYEFYPQSSPTFIAAAPLYGNGTMIFQVAVGNGEVLHDWSFERMTSDGTLQVSLMRSNGTVVWQGSAAGANYTVTSPGNGLVDANVTV